MPNTIFTIIIVPRISIARSRQLSGRPRLHQLLHHVVSVTIQGDPGSTAKSAKSAKIWRVDPSNVWIIRWSSGDIDVLIHEYVQQWMDHGWSWIMDDHGSWMIYFDLFWSILIHVALINNEWIMDIWSVLISKFPWDGFVLCLFGVDFPNANSIQFKNARHDDKL